VEKRRREKFALSLANRGPNSTDEPNGKSSGKLRETKGAKESAESPGKCPRKWQRESARERATGAQQGCRRQSRQRSNCDATQLVLPSPIYNTVKSKMPTAIDYRLQSDVSLDIMYTSPAKKSLM